MLLFHPRVKLFLMDSNLQKHCQMLISPNFIKYGSIVQTIYLALIIHSDIPKYVYFLCIALVINVLKKKNPFHFLFKLNKLPWSCCGLSQEAERNGFDPQLFQQLKFSAYILYIKHAKSWVFKLILITIKWIWYLLIWWRTSCCMYTLHTAKKVHVHV